MKIDFPPPDDKKCHRLCPGCRSEKTRCFSVGKKTYYLCESCRNETERLLVFDPKLKWWVDEATQEYWHEGSGIFVINPKNEVLLFERTHFPFGLAIPAGHLECGETPLAAAQRELFEETELDIPKENFKLFSQEDIVGDKCRRGSDNHAWNLFTVKIENPPSKIKINEEGEGPTWLSLEKALQSNLTYTAKFFIEKYGNRLLK